MPLAEERRWQHAVAYVFLFFCSWVDRAVLLQQKEVVKLLLSAFADIDVLEVRIDGA